MYFFCHFFFILSHFLFFFFFFLMIRPPPRSPLFPYPPLFRSELDRALSRRQASESHARARRSENPCPRADVDGLAALGHVARDHAGVLGPHPHLRAGTDFQRSEEHTSELQSLTNLVCRLLLEK